jgi:pyruvate-formate lyase-activating enzyme
MRYFPLGAADAHGKGLSRPPCHSMYTGYFDKIGNMLGIVYLIEERLFVSIDIHVKSSGNFCADVMCELSCLDLVMLDIKSSDPKTYRSVTGRELAPTLRFAERLAALGKPVWVRFTLVPGFTDDLTNVDGIARFVAPMRNVEWVEVQPFHQLGAFNWKAMNLEYKHANTSTPTPDLIERVIEQFRAAGCRAR